MKVKTRVYVKWFMKLLPGYAFFFCVLALLALVYGLIARSLVGLFPLFVSFASLRYEYYNSITYHNPSTKKCIFLSIAMFAICSFPLIVLNLKVSLLASVPIAIGMTWLLHELGKRDIYRKELAKFSSIEKFDADNCTKEQLLKRRKELKFSKDKTDMCVKMFIDKVSYNKLADEYCIEPTSIGISKMRLKKKLNKS